MFNEGNTYKNSKTKETIFVVSVESESEVGSQLMIFYVNDDISMRIPDEILIEKKEYKDWKEVLFT